MYRQLGMVTRTGYKTIAGYLTLLQTWIYKYFPSFHPHPRQADMPNKTRVEIWSPQKLIRELSRLIDCRSILDSMTETQVFTHAPPERTVRQLGFAQAIPPPTLRSTQALRLAQISYSVTFASPSMYTEMRKVVPEYIDWFRVSSHTFLIPGEGPTTAFCAADNRVEYFAAEFPTRLAPLLRMYYALCLIH
ncbi:uncharacterized protein LOC130813514 [Amaranthus tricolor]|uniref:uncharacterized protein LOC130813514 n=1 Tax=Amaranthus tricolor TaxID=29722 RepID=UPI00258E848A|nr:uncharacterized protein LOC130813514 [Amaranthus tricolor]